MKRNLVRYQTLIGLVIIILAIFIVRTAIARTALSVNGHPPRLSDLFTAITVLGSLVVVIKDTRCLRRRDWFAALFLGGVVGVSMVYATLFSPYPFFDIVRDQGGQAVVRGVCSAIAVLGGLVIMRQAGPVVFHAANGDWRSVWRGIAVGLAAGLPLAVLNVFALQMTQGQPMQWQNPLAALLDALQPGIVEEVIYRFALWGLLWMALRKSLPNQAVWLAGGLALLVHNYIHFDELFVQAPLAALGMGLVMSVIWGLPLAFLARRRGLESAISFHWMQDVARFMAGF